MSFRSTCGAVETWVEDWLDDTGFLGVLLLAVVTVAVLMLFIAGLFSVLGAIFPVADHAACAPGYERVAIESTEMVWSPATKTTTPMTVLRWICRP